jgi:hypothetical protein
LLGCVALALFAAGDDPGSGSRAAGSSCITEDPPRQPPGLKLPDWWKAGDPLPLEKTNCVRCHLTAGRELTMPVHDFARSAHDLARLSCNDCHGGNTNNDVAAHEPEGGFIGTKLSAHMAGCASCHAGEAQVFSHGKHYWDLTKSINKKLPVCIDCHGNHDVGNPPADFALTNVCADCHKQLGRDLPQAARVVAGNDRLWKVLRDVHARRKTDAVPNPERFQGDIDRVRAATARLLHRAGPITDAEAQALDERVRKLTGELEGWLINNKTK